MYGRGWYMCYDLDSQLKARMSGYGDALIKSEIYSKGLLIFDYNIARKVYGNDYPLIHQLLEQNIYRNEEEIPRSFFLMSKVLEQTFINPSFSAAIAANSWVGGKNPAKVKPSDYAAGWSGNKMSFLDPSKGTPKNKKITGIMFSGNHDGNVVVIYNPDTAKPIEYANAAFEDWGTDLTEKDITWLPISDAETVEKRVSLTREIYEVFNGTMLKMTIDPASHIRNMATFKSTFPWLMKAKFSDAEFSIDENDRISMVSGTWLNGTWKGHFMFGRVTFKGGIYDGLVMFSGTWLNGTWNQKNALEWNGYTTSSSWFNYEEDGDYVRTKENPREYYDKQ